MKKTPENNVKKEIKDYLKLNGWFVRHNLQGIGCYKGMPDMKATKNGITIEIECKSKEGDQSDKQREYEQDLVDHGGHYLVARGYEDIKRWEEDYRGSY